MNAFAKALGLLAIFLSAGCFLSVKPDDLNGIFVGESDLCKITLTLSSDGQCLQEVVVGSSSKVSTAKGQWKYDDKSKCVVLTGTMVVLDGFKKLRKDYEVIPAGVTGFFPVGRNIVGRAVFGSDEGLVYKKQK